MNCIQFFTAILYQQSLMGTGEAWRQSGDWSAELNKKVGQQA
jgi:hypothetical protein